MDQTITYISININGISKTRIDKFLLKEIKTHRPTIVALQEFNTPHVSKSSIQSLSDAGYYLLYTLPAFNTGGVGFLVDKLFCHTHEITYLRYFNRNFYNKGRVAALVIDHRLYVYNVYLPYSRERDFRLLYKLNILNILVQEIEILTSLNKRVVLMGDLNININKTYTRPHILNYLPSQCFKKSSSFPVRFVLNKTKLIRMLQSSILPQKMTTFLKKDRFSKYTLEKSMIFLLTRYLNHYHSPHTRSLVHVFSNTKIIPQHTNTKFPGSPHHTLYGKILPIKK